MYCTVPIMSGGDIRWYRRLQLGSNLGWWASCNMHLQLTGGQFEQPRKLYTYIEAPSLSLAPEIATTISVRENLNQRIGRYVRILRCDDQNTPP